MVPAQASEAITRLTSRTYRRTMSRAELVTALTAVGLNPSISATEQELRALEDTLGQLLVENDLLQDDLSNQETKQQ